MVVLAYNMKLFSERANGKFPMVWNRAFEGATPNSYTPMENEVPFSRAESIAAPGIDFQLDLPLEAMDPYGVTGMWRRVRFATSTSKIAFC